VEFVSRFFLKVQLSSAAVYLLMLPSIAEPYLTDTTYLTLLSEKILVIFHFNFIF